MQAHYKKEHPGVRLGNRLFEMAKPEASQVYKCLYCDIYVLLDFSAVTSHRKKNHDDVTVKKHALDMAQEAREIGKTTTLKEALSSGCRVDDCKTRFLKDLLDGGMGGGGRMVILSRGHFDCLRCDFYSSAWHVMAIHYKEEHKRKPDKTIPPHLTRCGLNPCGLNPRQT